MPDFQAAILAEEATLGRYLTFSLMPGSAPHDSLEALVEFIDPARCVVGFGTALLAELDASIPGMRNMQTLTGKGIEIPSTPASLWCWLRGNDRGELLHLGRHITQTLAADFELTSVVDSFQYDGNRDLSGYEDGTENPTGDDAIAAAFVSNAGAGLDGGSFVAVQQWVHDLDYLDLLDEAERDDIIGRHVSDNEEFESAPASAHVKRAAQESFEPEAFILRRSMPWADGNREGLMFVAFGKSFDAFEAILHRMAGLEDGISDALFQFTQPLTGAYFWCPPIKENKLDLSRLLPGD